MSCGGEGVLVAHHAEHRVALATAGAAEAPEAPLLGGVSRSAREYTDLQMETVMEICWAQLPTELLAKVLEARVVMNPEPVGKARSS
jgi:hypothetical protein